MSKDLGQLLPSSASVAALILIGCAVGPDFERPGPPDVTSYTAIALPDYTAAGSDEIAASNSQNFVEGAEVPAQWWALFGSDELTEMVEMALAANPDIDAAEAALAQVQEVYLAARGPLFPSVDVNSGVQRQQSPQTSNTRFNSSLLNLYNVSTSVSYALDVFGGTRRALEAAGARVDNARFETEATYLTLVANVLTAAIKHESLSGQVAAFEKIIAVQSQALDLMKQEFELGAVARGDVLAQQAELEQIQASLPNLQKEMAHTGTTLTILLGRYPAEGVPLGVSLSDITLPQELPFSVPSELVNQRPDVRAAEALLHEASANIGVATANMLPRFTLSGSYGSTTTSVPGSAGLFSSGSIGWSLAAGVTAPIFRGGELSAQRRSALYSFELAEAQYRSTVLGAFADVADVLNALHYDAEALRRQERAAETARESLEITSERFRAGAIGYLPLLYAQRAYQQALIALVQTQAARLADTVALFQALGGGWWNREIYQADLRNLSDG